MPTPVTEKASTTDNKYTLRSLHQEIDLFDRKLAHMAQYDVSPTGPARDAAERKLSLKREQLAQRARQLVADGIAYEPSELPRSFRPKDAPVPAKTAAAPAETTEIAPDAAAVTPAAETRKERRHPSAFAGTALDGDRILEYMRDRRKA